MSAGAIICRRCREPYEAGHVCPKLNEPALSPEALVQVREALEFYAQQYGLGSRLASDGGAKARAALRLLPPVSRNIPVEAAAFDAVCEDDSQNEPPDFETNDGFDDEVPPPVSQGEPE